MTADSPWSDGRYPTPPPVLSTGEWSREQFLASRAPWQSLLARSDADPLFLSWDWLATWLAHHEARFGLQPRFFTVSAGEKLVGAAAVFLRDVVVRPGFRGRRLELVGNVWRQAGVAMSEYMGFVLDADWAERAADALVETLLDLPDWDEMVVANCVVQGATFRQLRVAGRRRGWHVRHADAMEAFDVALPASPEVLRASLGRNTRDRVFGARRRLATEGTLEEALADRDGLAAALDELDRLHERRWGRPGLRGARGEFYRAFAALQVAEGLQPVSLLTLDGRPFSACLNFRAGQAEYAIQSGFLEDVGRRVSPGYLHIGYCMERAAREGVQRFDLLGGAGKQVQYKRHFGGRRRVMSGLQMVRPTVLRTLYRGYDRLTGRGRLSLEFPGSQP